MSDIVEKLREQGEWRSDKAWDGCPIAEEAADEITRLREENARLRELLDDAFAQWDGDWPEELVARVKAVIGAEQATGGP